MFSCARNWAYRVGRTIKWTSITLFCLFGCVVGALGIYLTVGDPASPIAWMMVGSGLMCAYMLFLMAYGIIGILPDYSKEYADQPLVKLGQGDCSQVTAKGIRPPALDARGRLDRAIMLANDPPLLTEVMKRLSPEELESWKKKIKAERDIRSALYMNPIIEDSPDEEQHAAPPVEKQE